MRSNLDVALLAVFIAYDTGNRRSDLLNADGGANLSSRPTRCKYELTCASRAQDRAQRPRTFDLSLEIFEALALIRFVFLTSIIDISVERVEPLLR